MKAFFKWASLALLAVVLLYTLLVFVVGPVTYETRFEVDRPLADVWAVFHDETRLKDWLPGLQSIETVEGEPMTVGSRYRLTFVEEGSEVVMYETVTSVVPEREFAFLLTHEIVDSDITVSFEDLDGRTAVVTRNEVRGKGVLKPLMPLLKASMIERQQQGYDALKALIEADES